MIVVRGDDPAVWVCFRLFDAFGQSPPHFWIGHVLQAGCSGMKMVVAQIEVSVEVTLPQPMGSHETASTLPSRQRDMVLPLQTRECQEKQKLSGDLKNKN